jgi:hypothetical protein
MKKLLKPIGCILAPLLILIGCSTTVPVARKFPEVPDVLMVPCPPLTQIKEGTTKLSGVIEVVTDNYFEYHKCSDKHDLWMEWYKAQKEIFDSVK